MKTMSCAGSPQIGDPMLIGKVCYNNRNTNIRLINGYKVLNFPKFAGSTTATIMLQPCFSNLTPSPHSDTLN